MVAQWGFAMEALGNAPVAWETPNGNGMMNPRVASQEMESQIDIEVQKIVDAAYDICYKTLSDNKKLMDTLAKRLIENESVDFEELAVMRDSHLAGAATA